MKFTIDRILFHKAIAAVENIIPARDIRSVISNILIEVQAGEIVLTSTDLEIGIKTSIPVQESEEGSILVPAKRLSQSIRDFRASQILFEVNDDKVSIKDGSGKSVAETIIMGSSSEEFPKIATPDRNQFMSFPPAVALEMIRKTVESIAEEDARYVFNGLFISNNGTQVAFVGTDGRRLSKIERDFPEPLPFKEGIVLPIKAVKELQKQMDSSQEGSIAYNEKDRRVFFQFGSLELITKLIDGQFPDYNQVIPKSSTHTVLIDKSILDGALKQVTVMAPEPSRQVKFSFDNNNIFILANTPDVGESKDSIPVSYKDEEMTIAFNCTYIQDVLKVLSSKEIAMGFSSPSAPVVIQDPDDQKFISVVMPMKI